MFLDSSSSKIFYSSLSFFFYPNIMFSSVWDPREIPTPLYILDQTIRFGNGRKQSPPVSSVSSWAHLVQYVKDQGFPGSLRGCRPEPRCKDQRAFH